MPVKHIQSAVSPAQKRQLLGLVVPETPAVRAAREARQEAEAVALKLGHDEDDVIETVRQMIRESGVDAVRRHIENFKD